MLVLQGMGELVGQDELLPRTERHPPAGEVHCLVLRVVVAERDGVGCIGQEGVGLVYHWHTDLTISSGAASVSIPAGIGISTFCLEPLHTHEANGQIHIETQTARLYSIGDFFRVWGKSFGNPTAMHVNGTAVTPNPSVILYGPDGIETIHLQYDSFS